MGPLLLTLLGYPLGILSSLTYDQLKSISEKTDIVPLKDLFLKAFYTSLKYHDEHYDEYSKQVIEKLRKAVKKNEDKLLEIFSKHSDNYNNFLSLVKTREFQNKIAKEIVSQYSLDIANYPRLIPSIISDCLNYYLYAFFNQMNEKEGIQTILIECLKLNSILDLLKQIDSNVVTKNDFDELRRIVLLRYFKENTEAQKKLEDYDQYLKNKFKYLELRGFSPKVSGKEVQMELLDIFVPLEISIDKPIVPSIEPEESPLLQRTSEPYDSSKKEDKQRDPVTSILKHRCLVILGDPGSGKSILMKHLTVTLTHSRDSGNLLANIIPLYVRISDYADYFKETRKTLFEFITEHYDRQYQHIFKEGFEYSNLLLLMDGLDEVTDTPLRIRVTEQVMDLIARYPYNRYIVTSRIVGYQESKLGGDFRQYKLMPFGLDEIRLFSEQWYKSIAQHTDQEYGHAKEQADSLYSSISRSPSVIRLATNPLLMTIIAMIHYKGKKLPNKRVELYDISTETFLEYWVQMRMDDESKLKDKSEIIEILAPIAFQIHESKSNALIEEKEFVESFLVNFKNIHTSTSDMEAKRECREFIDFLREEAGFFYEKGEDEEGNRFYGFIHLTFQEYLAAIELVSRWNERRIDLKDYVFNPRWTEILRLAACQLRLSYKGRTGRIQSTQFVRDILSVDDPFPEAYRPLQLVCLILSDDVNVTDEFLNVILDEIIKVAATTNFAELTESFSKLFREMLYSDYRNTFIDRFEKEVITSNVTLLNNLMYILASNSEDATIDKILVSVHNRDKETLRALYQIPFKNFAFQRSVTYKEGFIDYLIYLKSQNEEEELEEGFGKLMTVITGKYWYGWLEADSVLKIVSTIDQIATQPLFDDILNFTLDYALYRYMQSGDKRVLDTFLTKYSEKTLVRNLSKSLNDIHLGKMKLGSFNAFTIFMLEHYRGCLLRGDKDLQLWLWSRTYDKLFSHSLSSTGIASYLRSLKPMFSDLDLQIIERYIYFILEPQEDANIENTARFIKAAEEGMLYDFFNWELFPLININSNPSVLSKIVVQYGERYINQKRRSRVTAELQLNLKDFDNEQICPVAKLLAYHLLNKQFSQELLEEGIEYFRTCSSIEKKGAFSILYNLLNPFQLT